MKNEEEQTKTIKRDQAWRREPPAATISAVRNPKVTNPGGKKLAVLEAAGVKLPTEAEAARAREEAERWQRIRELDQRLSLAAPQTRRRYSTSSSESERSSERREHERETRDLQLAASGCDFPADEYLINIGPKAAKKVQIRKSFQRSVNQVVAVGRMFLAHPEDKAKAAADEELRARKFVNELNQIGSLPRLCQVLDAKIAEKKHFDPRDACKRPSRRTRNIESEQEALSQVYIKYQAYDLYTLIRGEDSTRPIACLES